MWEQKWLKPFRIVISLFFLIGLISVFSDVRAKLPSGLTVFLTYFQFWPSIQKLTAAAGILATGFVFVILLTLFAGRIYCSALCPLGALQDVLGYIRRKIPGKKAMYRFKNPLNYIRYPVLVTVIASLLFIGILGLNLLDPFANFGRIVATLYQPAFILINNLISQAFMSMGIYSIQPIVQKEFYSLPFISALTILLVIVIMVIYRGRLYCNTICPLGALLGLISKVSFLKIKISESNCTQCGKCQTDCKASCINIKSMSIDETRCVSCFNCISICEESSIRFTRTLFNKKKSPGEITDRRKREFLKAGMLFIGSYPLISNSIGGNTKQPNSFDTRGPISPPGSLSISHLKENCVACQLCISVCPTKVLQPAFLEFGFTGMMMPRMNNNSGFCNYNCTKCGEICPAGAILTLKTEEKKVTQIGTVCFERNLCIVVTKNKSCGSCSEHCPTQAVYMVPYKGFLTIPETNVDICIGCGACEHVCPVTDPHAAIYVLSNEVHKIAKKPVIDKKPEVETTDDFPF
jgi:ferredoxin